MEDEQNTLGFISRLCEKAPVPSGQTAGGVRKSSGKKRVDVPED